MKVLIRNYSFNKTLKQIAFTDLTSIKLEEILIITNVTDNQIIYNFADPSCGGTVIGNVLTLTYDTSSMSDSDDLQIFIDVEEVQLATEAFQEDIFKALLGLLKSTTYARDAGDRMRVIMDNNPMLYSYMRNSSTVMGGSTETYYSASGHTTVDAREQLKAIQDSALIGAMQKWRVQ